MLVTRHIITSASQVKVVILDSYLVTRSSSQASEGHIVKFWPHHLLPEGTEMPGLSFPGNMNKSCFMRRE